MKFVFEDRQREYFLEYHHIEFEGLVKETLLDAVEEELSKKLSSNEAGIHRDRRHAWSALGRLACSRQLAEFAGELVRLRPIRLGSDVVISCGNSDKWQGPKWPAGPQSLGTVTGLQDVVCGVVVRLTEPVSAVVAEDEADAAEDPFVPMPSKRGNGVFIAPEFAVDLQELCREDGQRFLLLTYVNERARYVDRKDDPHRNFLKGSGYGFGDRLKEKTHPVVYR